MQGLMQDRPLTLPHFFNRAETPVPRQGDRHGTATGHRAARPTASGPSAPAGSAACSTTSASAPTAGSATFAWNTARHLELYFAAPCSGPGAAHAQHPAVPRAGHLHRQPRRGRGDLRRPVAARSALAAARRRSRPSRHIVVMDDGGARSRAPTAGADPRLRGPARRRDARRVARRGREPGRVDVLHERHHRQPQGRRLQPPLDLPAHDGVPARRQPRRRASATRSCRSCRCSTPTPGASPTPPWRAGPNLVMPGPDLTPDRHRRPDRDTRRSPSPPASPPSGWVCCPS